jgi:hypothetical protein
LFGTATGGGGQPPNAGERAKGEKPSKIGNGQQEFCRILIFSILFYNSFSSLQPITFSSIRRNWQTFKCWCKGRRPND